MIIIYTDLDGTLLDYDGYQWSAAGGGLHHVRRERVPLVFNSSKTLEEQKGYQHEMDLDGPLIVESGSAVIFRDGYFSAEAVQAVGERPGELRKRRMGDRIAFLLGRPVDEVRAALREARRETGLTVQGFGDMSLAEIRERTGLPEAMARRARAREYSETIWMDGDGEAWERLRNALKSRGVAVQGSGPSVTLVGAGTNKGRAAEVVTELFRRDRSNDFTTAAIGDDLDDLPMFDVVDRAFLVERKDGGWAEIDPSRASRMNLKRVEGPGPHGWERAVRELLERPVKQSRPRASIWDEDTHG